MTKYTNLYSVWFSNILCTFIAYNFRPCLGQDFIDSAVPFFIGEKSI